MPKADSQGASVVVSTSGLTDAVTERLVAAVKQAVADALADQPDLEAAELGASHRGAAPDRTADWLAELERDGRTMGVMYRRPPRVRT